jgi:hypothetical protein
MKSYLIAICLMAVIASTSNAQPTPQRTTKVVKPQRLVSKKAYDKRAIINHLVNTHKMRSVDISRLSINQLWYLHDSEHDKEVKAKTSNVYCPPGQT